MTTKVYNKLVRDRIPEIIKADGNACTTEILPDDRYLQMLDAKLNEELTEYQVPGGAGRSAGGHAGGGKRQRLELGTAGAGPAGKGGPAGWF